MRVPFEINLRIWVITANVIKGFKSQPAAFLVEIWLVEDVIWLDNFGIESKFGSRGVNLHIEHSFYFNREVGHFPDIPARSYTRVIVAFLHRALESAPLILVEHSKPEIFPITILVEFG